MSNIDNIKSKLLDRNISRKEKISVLLEFNKNLREDSVLEFKFGKNFPFLMAEYVVDFYNYLLENDKLTDEYIKLLDDLNNNYSYAIEYIKMSESEVGFNTDKEPSLEMLFSDSLDTDDKIDHLVNYRGFSSFEAKELLDSISSITKEQFKNKGITIDEWLKKFMAKRAKETTVSDIVYDDSLSNDEKKEKLKIYLDFNEEESSELIKKANKEKRKAKLKKYKREISKKAKEIYTDIPSDDKRKPIPDDVIEITNYIEVVSSCFFKFGYLVKNMLSLLSIPVSQLTQ